MVDSALPQDFSGLPSTSTTHEPHCSAPQPNLVPTRPRWLRSTSSSGVSGSALTVTAFPLTIREVACIGFSLTENQTIVDRPLPTQGDDDAFHAVAQSRRAGGGDEL